MKIQFAKTSSKFLVNVLSLLTIVFVSCTQAVWAKNKVDSALVMNLSIYSAERWTDVKTHPIHLNLSIYNDTARIQDELNRNNAKMLRAYKEDDTLKSMDEKSREKLAKALTSVPIQSIKLGRKDLPINEWFEWNIVDENGNSVSAQVDILTIDKEENPVITFDQKESRFLNFGIQPGQLKKLAPGKYSIKANLSSKVQSTGITSKTASNSVDLSLVSSKDSSSSMTYHYGLFHILDRNYDQAMVYANELLKNDPNSLGGNALLARVLVGKRQWSQAQPVLRKYFSLYEKKFLKASSSYHPPRFYQLLLAVAQKNIKK